MKKSTGNRWQRTLKNIAGMLPIQVASATMTTSVVIFLTFYFLLNATTAVQTNSSSPIAQLWQSPKLVYILKGHTGTVDSLAFSPDSKILFSGGGENDTQIRLWNPEIGKQVAIIRGAQAQAVLALAIAPNGQTLASCSDDTTINVWDLQTKQFSRSLRGHTSNVMSLAVTPDSQILVSGALDGIRLWNLTQKRPLATFVRFDNQIRAIAISPNGQLLASGSQTGVVKLWELNTGQLITTSSGHLRLVSSIAFTPDGEILVTGSHDRTIKLWNVRTGQLIRTLTGHTGWVKAIAIHPNGQILASAGQDGIRLWQMSTGRLMTTLTEHSDWVNAIAFSPDGYRLASGGLDKRIIIWQDRDIRKAAINHKHS